MFFLTLVLIAITSIITLVVGGEKYIAVGADLLPAVVQEGRASKAGRHFVSSYQAWQEKRVLASDLPAELSDASS